MIDNKVKLTGCSINPRECRCFEVLTEEELQYLENHSARVTYKKGEIICKQGVMVSSVLYVEKGLAKVYIDDGKNSLVLKIIPDNNLIGLAAVNEEFNTHQYSAKAYIDTEIIQIDVDAFRELIRRNSDFAREIIDVLSSNSVQIYGRFFCITHKQSYGRLADILLCLADRIFKKSEFELPLSRADLAELTGMSSETVIRTLKKFQGEGLIEMKGKHIEVQDFIRLQQISETG
jgi:CRP/FNR family transcriptional regulator